MELLFKMCSTWLAWFSVGDTRFWVKLIMSLGAHGGDPFIAANFTSDMWETGIELTQGAREIVEWARTTDSTTNLGWIP